ncbi:hypothetical protein [Burkholderia sp. 22PA0106]|uniref:hypothetical protein n=1 Tax=Burkholderia sp. 22PA0106 TaxID=3237371 RepID=UPI0039C3C1AC
MRKIIFTLVLATAAAHANAFFDACSMKRSQAEATQFYQYSVSGGMLRMRENFKRIGNSDRVSNSEKQSLQDNQAKWEKAVKSKCDDDACYYQAIGTRNDEIEKFMRDRNLQPM